ncbi:alkaline phosphatase D family protein [Sphingomonas crocodyli]|nr:alkaline phosphatase D family protein [Sphingomonas crocodyli]
MTHFITRRGLLVGAAAATAAAPAILKAQMLFRDYPFRLGVAAGEPAADGFVIWTRLAPDPLDRHGGMPMAKVDVDWEVAADEGFKQIIQKGTAAARPEIGHSVHVELAGLQPARPYFYRFRIGREVSPIGRAKTLPAIGVRTDRMRFAVAGCQAWEDGLYTAFADIADQEIDFLYHYGDYIYEGRRKLMSKPGHDGRSIPVVRDHLGDELYSLDDYRLRYAQYRMDPNLQAAHRAAAWFATFDDHEVSNDWVSDHSAQGTPPELFLLRRQAAFQAYYEYMPLRRASIPMGASIQAYRRARFGDLADIHLLDTRQFRTSRPCGENFTAECDAVRDPKAQVLGSAQEAWLTSELRQKAGRWNVLAQQVMMMNLARDRDGVAGPKPTRNFDSWAGYLAPRDRLLRNLDGLGNVVVLTGDEHQNFAGELAPGDGAGKPVAVEFVSTSISSGGSGSDARYDQAQVMAANPTLKFKQDQRGYLLCDVAPDLWTSRFRTVDKVHEPGGVVSTRATFAIEHGNPKLVQA